MKYFLPLSFNSKADLHRGTYIRCKKKIFLPTEIFNFNDYNMKIN